MNIQRAGVWMWGYPPVELSVEQCGICRTFQGQRLSFQLRAGRCVYGATATRFLWGCRDLAILGSPRVGWQRSCHGHDGPLNC